MEPIDLTVRLDDGDSVTDASYRLSPASAAADTQQVGQVLYMLADRVIHGLGLPTPRDVQELERREREAADVQPPAEPEPEGMPTSLDATLERIQLEAEVVEHPDKDGVAMAAKVLRRSLAQAAAAVERLRGEGTRLTGDLMDKGTVDPAERLAGNLAMLDHYPVLQALEQEG